MSRTLRYRFLPTSLLGRSLAILLVPIVLLQLVVGFVFFQRHYQRVTEQMTGSVAQGLYYAVTEAERAATPDEASERLTAIARPLAISLLLEPGATVEPGVTRDAFDFTGRTVAATLREELPRDLHIDLSGDDNMALIEVQTQYGVMHTALPRSDLSVPNPHQLLVLMTGAAILLGAISIVFMRNQIRPIRRLAEASEEFGKGRAHSFHPSGADEVRRAGTAFLAMRGRIERQIEQRTQMLSGVSHDLRTPLTRMKLTLALMEESEETEALSDDVNQMQHMLAEFLAFARGDSTEATVPTDPFELAGDLADRALRAGHRIDLIEANETPGNCLVPLRPMAVTRAVQNLTGNAAVHGDRIRLTVRLTRRALAFIVEDDGPGIPVGQRQAALQPFSRLDRARNQDAVSGNVGLGLSIAMDVARSHGGTLVLGESTDFGGLRADLRLPR